MFLPLCASPIVFATMVLQISIGFENSLHLPGKTGFLVERRLTNQNGNPHVLLSLRRANGIAL